MNLISGKFSFVQCKETNVRFVLFYCVIFVRKMFSYSKSMMLTNFVIDFFPVSCTVFEIKMLGPKFQFFFQEGPHFLLLLGTGKAEIVAMRAGPGPELK